LGAHVEQFYALDPKERNPTLSGELGSGAASIWAEVLQVDSPDTHVLLRYAAGMNGSNGWLAGRPAAVEHTVGQGKLTYIGATLDPALMRSAVEHILDGAGVAPILPGLPEGVELMQRVGDHRSIWIIVNHNAAEREVVLQATMRDLLSTSPTASTRIELAGHGVAVLTAEAKR
jgi:beta-galactosidase